MSMGTCLKGNTHPCCSSVFPDDKNHGVILGADNEKKNGFTISLPIMS